MNVNFKSCMALLREKNKIIKKIISKTYFENKKHKINARL